MYSTDQYWSAQSVNQIDDIVLKILNLVPRKSRGRFKSVSKQWLSLISHNFKPLPALLFQSASPDGHLLPCLDAVTATDEPSLITKHTVLRLEPGPQSQITCLRSSNGLLLLARTRTGPNRIIHTRYYVYNTLTCQHDTFPPPCPADYHHVTASLAHDPARSAHYKVVCLYKYRTKPVTRRIMIYSSETRRWRRWHDTWWVHELDRIGDCSYNRGGANGCYWNGSVYYISDSSMLDYRYIIDDNDDRFGHYYDPYPEQRSNAAYYKLYRFDPESEEMEEVKLPSEGSVRASRFKRLVASWGRLRLLVMPNVDDQEADQDVDVLIRRSAAEELIVYEMESDGLSWSVKYNINHFGDDLCAKLLPYTNEIDVKFGPFSGHNYRLHFPPPPENGEDEDELWLIVEVPRLILRYNFKIRTVDIVKLGSEELEIKDQRNGWRNHDHIVNILELPRAV